MPRTVRRYAAGRRTWPAPGRVVHSGSLGRSRYHRAVPGLRLVPPGGVLAALQQALDGGEPFAPLPEPGPERERLVAALRPDQPVTEDHAAVVVATSGSTGDPRGVVLSRPALVTAANLAHNRLGGPGVWVCALPQHHVAGLMVLVRSLVAGRQPILVSPRLTGLATLQLSRPAYLSLVPAQLYRALRDPDTRAALGRFDAVLVGGAATSQDEVEAARRAQIRVVTTYGASETCGGVVYDGLPLDQVTVKVLETDQITITTPTLCSGYRLDPARTRSILAGKTFLTSDRGSWVDGRLVVRGRVDDVVISGGVNVDLAALQRLVDAEYGAEQVVVAAIPDPRWGQRVVAVSVAEVNLPQLVRRLRPQVARAAEPTELRQVAEVPRTRSGKIDRAQIVALWQE